MDSAHSQKAIVESFRKNFKKLPMVSMLTRQQLSAADSVVKGPVWISNVSFPPPKDNTLRDSLHHVVRELSEGTESFRLPNYSSSMPAEWVGTQTRVVDPASTFSENDKFRNLTADARNRGTILFVHGGAFS